MPEAPIGAGRPRPVADVPPAALADGEAPAKQWLVRLVAARPLRDTPALPMADLVRDAPPLCAAILRAVGSDGALPALERGGELVRLAARAGALAGAGSPASAVAAVGHLRAALWETLTESLGPLDASTTAALATRLAHVCDLITAATVTARSHDTPVPFHMEDTRRAATSADWRGAAARLVGDGRGFALLAVEVDDAERLLAADGDGAAGALGRVEDALRAQLRPDEVLGREGEGRFWLVATDLGSSGGRARAERVADAVAAVSLHGAPLSASIGVAAHPEDGHDADELAAHADRALFAARAAGVRID
jgi:GGDEF domain-containing protein